MVDVGEPETWKPTRQNCVVGAEMAVMHGGPIGMSLPEHEHPEVQVGMHFVPPQICGKSQPARDLQPAQLYHFRASNDIQSKFMGTIC